MTTAKAAPFQLPRVKWSEHGVSLLSLRQDALALLGQYTPRDGPVVVDPLWTRAAVPEAIAVHETMHQFLYKNTALGALTQLLLLMLKREAAQGHLAPSFAAGLAREVLPKCFEIQWCVQELAATYAEMSVVARIRPELLEQEVRGLPSGRLDQPPYREVFDAMDRLLSVNPDIGKEASTAQSNLVMVLVAASMNSDCLLRMAEVKERSARALLTCMTDPPDSRLERIVNHLLANDLLEPLREEAMSPGMLLETLYERIVAMVPGLPIYRDADLMEQAHQANRAWNDFTHVNVVKERGAEPLPSIMESREREQLGLAANPVRDLPAGQLRERLGHTERNALGLLLELWLRDPSQAYVAARPYFLKKGAAPFPAGKEDYGPDPLPVDLTGVMSTPEILRELAAFPALPHIVVFGDDTWRRWNQIPGARARFESCVRVCRQTHVTQNYVLYLLQFVQSGDELPDFLVRDLQAGRAVPIESLGEGAEVVALKLKGGGHAGCIFNRSRPLVYGLQKLHNELAMQLFLEICKRLGIAPSVDEPAGPFVDLLTMVSNEFAF